MKVYTPMRPTVKRNLQVKDSNVPGIGKGCFAGESFSEDEQIGEYTGEILHEDDAARRPPADEHDFLFDIGDELVIDPRYDPNPVKFINHSCQPNCESEQEGKRVFIKAIRDIQAGEELFYMYNMQPGEDDEDGDLQCHCGMPGCKGTMMDTDTPPDED